MKRVFYAIVCALVAIGCQSQSSNQEGKFTISGTFDNADGAGRVSLIEGVASLDDVVEMKVLDETGNFSFSGKVDTPYMVQISKVGKSLSANYRGIVFVERGDITISLNDRGQMIASGTALNDKFTLLIEEFAANVEILRELPHEEATAQFRTFVDMKLAENLDNPIGVFLLTQVVLRGAELDSDKIMEQISRFTPEMQAGKDIVDIKSELERMAALEVGAQYIPLTLPNVKGIDVAISSLVGRKRWLLIDFWATWCPPCMAEITHLKKAYDEYHQFGFEICGISLDNDIEKWSSYCIENLPWINLIAEGSNAAELYRVESIPFNLLISPDGKILAKNLRGNAITNELAKHIKK